MPHGLKVTKCYNNISFQLGQNVDSMSEEIEFNRLTGDDKNEASPSFGESSSNPPKDFKGESSDMSLLQHLATKQSID